MRHWRISAHSGLTGVGGTRVSGRWHTAPRPVIYAAEHPALAMLEVLAHMQITAATVPVSLRLIEIVVAGGGRRAKTPVLPTGWQANHPATQTLGNAWLDANRELFLPVPSALVPQSGNVLINPRHTLAATHLSEIDHGPVWIDPRFIR